MITIFDNISERRKKSLKHHSGAILCTVLRYARESKVALLLIIELVVKIAAGIFCLIHTNRQADFNIGIKRHNFNNWKMYAVSEYYVAKNEKSP